MARATQTPTARAREVEETWPLLTFHYGLSPATIARTPRVLLNMYVRQLGPILAQEQEQRIEAASFAYMEPEDQRAVRERLHEMRKSAAVEAEVAAQGGVDPLVQVVGMGIEVDLPTSGSETPRDASTPPSAGRWPGAISGGERPSQS